MMTNTDFPLKSLLESATIAATKAGAKIMEIYQSGFEVIQKSDHSPLTEADRAAHAIIFEELSYHGIEMVSEEGDSISFKKRGKLEKVWMIDPLDGTKEFINYNGEFTVNIALIENGVPVLGVVYVPVKKWLYLGAKGFQSKKFELEKHQSPLWDTKGMSLPINSIENKLRVVASKSHLNGETRNYISKLQDSYGKLEFLSAGSSLKLCLVAEGEADLYPRLAPTMEWDTAAGDAVCRYAACRVLNFETGKPLTYNKENLLNPWFKVVGHGRAF